MTALTAPTAVPPREKARAENVAETYDTPQTVPASGLVAVQTAPQTFPALGEFASSLLNGRADDVVGIYVDGKMALPVMQQPSGRADYVADEDNLLTQFSLPRQYGAVGLLAHNFLSGSLFPELTDGTEILVIYGGGQLRRFVVTGSQSFQALTPNSPFSQFVDPSDPGSVMTSAELFKRMYTTRGSLIFQTCIEAAGEPSWGRLFVTAEPVEDLQLTIPALETLNDLN